MCNFKRYSKFRLAPLHPKSKPLTTWSPATWYFLLELIEAKNPQHPEMETLRCQALIEQHNSLQLCLFLQLNNC